MKKVKLELNKFKVQSFVTACEREKVKAGLAPTKEFTEPTPMTWCYKCDIV